MCDNKDESPQTIIKTDHNIPQNAIPNSIKCMKSQDLRFSQRHCLWPWRWRHYVPSKGL